MSLIFKNITNLNYPVEGYEEQYIALEKMALDVRKAATFLVEIKKYVYKKFSKKIENNPNDELKVSEMKKYLFVEESFIEDLEKLAKHCAKNKLHIKNKYIKKSLETEKIREDFKKVNIYFKEIAGITKKVSFIDKSILNLTRRDASEFRKSVVQNVRGVKDAVKIINEINMALNSIQAISRDLNKSYYEFLEINSIVQRKQTYPILKKIYSEAQKANKFFRAVDIKQHESKYNERQALSSYYYKIKNKAELIELKKEADNVRSSLLFGGGVKNWFAQWRYWWRSKQKFETDKKTLLRESHFHLKLKIPGFTEVKDVHIVASA
jgi:hypothetical protein